MEKWRTKISVSHGGELYIRGIPLITLIKINSFAEIIFLLWRSTMPTPKEVKMLDAMLVSAVEHGIAVPSSFTTRTTISTGNPLHVAIAGGILTFGEWHGGAIEHAAEWLVSEKSPQDIIRHVVNERLRLAGFGHKIYKSADPRAHVLLQKARALGFNGRFISKLESVGKELQEKTGKVSYVRNIAK